MGMGDRNGDDDGAWKQSINQSGQCNSCTSCMHGAEQSRTAHGMASFGVTARPSMLPNVCAERLRLALVGLILVWFGWVWARLIGSAEEDEGYRYQQRCRHRYKYRYRQTADTAPEYRTEVGVQSIE